MQTIALICVFLFFFASNTNAQEGLEVRLQGGWVPAETIYAQGSKELPLCARYKNFFCVKTPGSTTWNGQTGQDRRKHAIFDDPTLGVRAFSGL